MYGRILKNTIICTTMLMLLAGCSPQEVSVSTSSEATDGTESGVSFTLPAYIPRALVDSAGYETGADKTVLFCTKETGEYFEVRTADDDTVVYTGKVKDFRSAGSGMSYGQFSSYQTPGEYYIYTEETGSSYSFCIEEGLNRQKLLDACERFFSLRCGFTTAKEGTAGVSSGTPCHTQPARLRQNPDEEKEVHGGWHTDSYGGRDTQEGCNALRDLLMILEIYPNRSDLQSITDEVMYELNWLLRMQDESGGVYGGVLTGGNEMSVNLTLTEITPEATVSFAGVLARAAYLFRESNPAFSEQSLTAAKKAWEYYAGHATATADSKAFSASSELYRLTGERKYENVLSAYFRKTNFVGLFREDDEIFYGSYAYINTTQPVNVEVCNTIMSALLEEAEKIADRSNESSYFVSAEDSDAILQNMLRLSVANHVIYNHEYTNILENHVHYLYGRNAKATDFVTGGKEVTAKGFEENSIYAKPVRLARFVVLLASL